MIKHNRRSHESNQIIFLNKECFLINIMMGGKRRRRMLVNIIK
jgi:hypothetical protein